MSISVPSGHSARIPPYAGFHASRTGVSVSVSTVLTFTSLGAMILNPIFGTYAALIFIACGGLLIAIRPAGNILILSRFWFVLILPAFCLLSTLWSQFPSVSMRHGIQLCLTFVIAVVLANRITAKEFVRGLFVIYSVGIVLSLVMGDVRQDIGAWIGIFRSKNAFAAFVAVYTLLCVAISMDRNLPVLFRWVGVAGFLISVPLLVLAQSVGAMLMTIPAVMVAFAIYMSRRLRSAHKLFILGLLLLTGTSAALILSAYGDVIFASLLERSGKDPNLTGRTDLWAFGRYMIEENFWLGVGYQAFWVQGYGPAEAFWSMFNITSRSGFNFHNTYISNAVEIGILGVFIQVLMLYGALLFCAVAALKSKSSEMIFLTSFLVFISLASFVEVAIFFQFSVTTIVAICALVFGIRHWRAAEQNEPILL